MLSADEVAGRLLMGWHAIGTDLRVYVRMPDLQLDSTGTVLEFVAGKILALEVDGSRVEVPLEGTTLSPAIIPEGVSSVAIMRGSFPVCVLIEPEKAD